MKSFVAIIVAVAFTTGCKSQGDEGAAATNEVQLGAKVASVPQSYQFDPQSLGEWRIGRVNVAVDLSNNGIFGRSGRFEYSVEGLVPNDTVRVNSPASLRVGRDYMFAPLDEERVVECGSSIVAGDCFKYSANEILEIDFERLLATGRAYVRVPSFLLRQPVNGARYEHIELRDPENAEPATTRPGVWLLPVGYECPSQSDEIVCARD